MRKGELAKAKAISNLLLKSQKALLQSVKLTCSASLVPCQCC